MYESRENPDSLQWALIWPTIVPRRDYLCEYCSREREKKKLVTAGPSFLWQRMAMALPSFCLWQHELLYLKSHSFLKLQWTCFHQQSSSGGKNYFIS